MVDGAFYWSREEVDLQTLCSSRVARAPPSPTYGVTGGNLFPPRAARGSRHGRCAPWSRAATRQQVRRPAGARARSTLPLRRLGPPSGLWCRSLGGVWHCDQLAVPEARGQTPENVCQAAQGVEEVRRAARPFARSCRALRSVSGSYSRVHAACMLGVVVRGEGATKVTKIMAATFWRQG